MRRAIHNLTFATLLLISVPAFGWYPRDAEESSLAEKGHAPVIGSNRYYQIAEGETLIQLARAFGLGYSNLAHANPSVDPWIPPAGHEIILPYATVLPSRLREGITINLADYKLYFLELKDGEAHVRIYPVGIGVEGWETPLGQFKILHKAQRPTWNVPEAIRREDPSLPKRVPPGPENPLGDFWMQFSERKHGIHGTNEPYGVGRRVSHGCIRLYPEDIKDLYRRTPAGTPVHVIYEPVKIGLSQEKVFLEVHPDYLDMKVSLDDILERYQRLGYTIPLDANQVEFAINTQLGVPLDVSSSSKLAAVQNP